MAIKEGDPLPSKILHRLGDDGAPKPLSTDEYFAGKRVVLFAVPGAFSSASVLPRISRVLQTCDTSALPLRVWHRILIREPW